MDVFLNKKNENERLKIEIHVKKTSLRIQREKHVKAEEQTVGDNLQIKLIDAQMEILEWVEKFIK